MTGTEMANNGAFDPIASYARLSERVEGQGRDIVDLRSNMNTGFRNIEGSIKSLSDQLASSGKTQWPLVVSIVGVAFAIMAGLGSQALSPIRDGLGRVEASTDSIMEKMVTQKELEWRTARGQEDRNRTDKAIVDIRADQVPRAEHERVWSGYDQRLADLQRQIDEAKNALGSTYSLRDYIQRMTDRLDKLETRTMPQPYRSP